MSVFSQKFGIISNNKCRIQSRRKNWTSEIHLVEWRHRNSKSYKKKSNELTRVLTKGLIKVEKNNGEREEDEENREK